MRETTWTLNLWSIFTITNKYQLASYFSLAPYYSSDFGLWTLLSSKHFISNKMLQLPVRKKVYKRNQRWKNIGHSTCKYMYDMTLSRLFCCDFESDFRLHYIILACSYSELEILILSVRKKDTKVHAIFIKVRLNVETMSSFVVAIIRYNGGKKAYRRNISTTYFTWSFFLFDGDYLKLYRFHVAVIIRFHNLTITSIFGRSYVNDYDTYLVKSVF